MRNTICYSLFTILLLFITLNSFAQIDTIRYFESWFEDVADQQQWTSLPADNQKKWMFQEGGLDSYNPDTAYNGNFNAFYYWGDPESFSRTLVSRQIDLSNAEKPELSFAYAMLPDVFGIHKLYLLMRPGPAEQWDTIASYSTAVPWTLKKYNISDFGEEYLTSTFQVAFLGVSGGGHGVCVDNVIIEEKEAIERYIRSLDAESVIHDLIPSGIKDVPLTRINIKVIGNTGTRILNSVTFSSLGSDDNIYENSGFELIAVPDSIFRPTLNNVSLKIGSASGIANGQVTFSGLNYTLPTGYTALFLVADIKPGAEHNSTAKFSLNTGSVNISGATYPSFAFVPDEHNTVEHSVLFEDFESTTGWLIENDFETAVPRGYVAHTTSDPDYAYSGAMVLGTDLTSDGRYMLNITFANAYFAVSPVMDLKYYDDVKLSFRKWIAFEGNDQAVIEVSTDTAKTWHRIWDSRLDALTPDYSWDNLIFSGDFDQIAGRQAWVQVRFGVVYSDNSFAYAGFNIDNFAVTGKYLTNDVGITDIIIPEDDCHNPGFDSVKVVIRNYADSPSAANIPVFFSLDGTPANTFSEVIAAPIPKDGTIVYAFSEPASFPSAGDYSDFSVGIDAPGDQDSDNNLVIKPVIIQESIIVPHTQDFENDGGYWKVYGSDPTWQCKVPEGSIPPIMSGSKSWILSPFGNYINSDTSYLESSCYDLSPAERTVLEMDLWIDSETGKDGALIEYSTDKGETWNVLTDNEPDFSREWYNGYVTSLGFEGWSGINTTGWIKVRQLLPSSLSREPNVKFRLKWAADDENSFRGMGFDNVKVYPAPADIGVCYIDSFADRCRFLNPETVKVAVKNMGLNKIGKNDTIMAGFAFNGNLMDIDTLILENDLLPGDSIEHSFVTKVDLTNPGPYKITAFTLGEKDPWFYNGNNDSLSVDFEIFADPLVTMAGDTILTHLPDTVVLRPYFDPVYEYLWEYDGSTGSEFSVPHAGLYRVQVTESIHGCVAGDSAFVELLFNDAGIDSIIFPFENCSLTDEPLTAVIKNYGNDDILAGEEIILSYSINSGPPVQESFVTDNALISGDTLHFRFSQTITLVQKGFHDLTTFCHFGGDTVSSNDTIQSQVEIFGHPSVDLGPDINIQALSVTLDAGEGHALCSWSNGSAERTIQVETPGEYSVIVADEQNCESYDTINVWLKIRDLKPQGFNSPVSDCSYGDMEAVSLAIVNSGTDTIPAGTEVEVSFSEGEGPAGTEQFNLIQDLLPGAYMVHTFENSIGLNLQGDYLFKGTAMMAGDMRPYNDTIDVVIYRYDSPVIDFGLEETEYIYDSEFIIDAGFQPFYSYQWQDDSTRHAYTVVSSGDYSVSVTDIRTSCYSGDTVKVFLIYNDVGITETDFPSEGCTGVFKNVKLRVTNLGATNLGSEMPIYIGCKVNDVFVAKDTLVRTANFAPGTYLDLILTAAIPVIEEGINNISFYTIFDDDDKKSNDTLKMPFTGLPSPVVDFGDIDGVLRTDLPHGLDAGEGNKAYLWQDGFTGRVYNVLTPGTYSVVVTGQNDCNTSKFVTINPASGIGELSGMDNFTIYPNPTDGLMMIEANIPGDGLFTLFVYNMSGQQVFAGEFIADNGIRGEFDLSSLPPGIYRVVISDKAPVFSGTLIIR